MPIQTEATTALEDLRAAYVALWIERDHLMALYFDTLTVDFAAARRYGAEMDIVDAACHQARIAYQTVKSASA